MRSPQAFEIAGFSASNRNCSSAVGITGQRRVRRQSRQAPRRRVFTARRPIEVVELALNSRCVGRQFMDGTAGIFGFAPSELGIALLGGGGDDLLALLDRL